ncbi:MAG: hypothetical protein KAQ85_03345, partial [Thermodesulfovibrionia bacterium]|nr:hypothetical protein [Thermodesulfovibrionia bacterium]
MKRLLIAIVAFIAFFAISAKAVTLLSVPQGGTGAGTFTAGDILQGNGTGSIQGNTMSGDATLAVGGALTIGADKIHDSMIDWGTGANQVSSSDMPDHNSHTVRDTFVDIINRGKSEDITITLTGGLGISWISGELYCQSCESFFTVDAGSGNVTDNAINYLKWVSGTALTISTTPVSGNEILVATGSVYDGVINGYRETSLINETISNTRRGLRALFPTRVISGMSVHEDTDVTNPLDVTMDAGVFWKDSIEQFTPIEIKSRNTAMVRHFHTSSAWDSDTNAEIETTNYDNGTDLTAITAGKYVKGLFIFMNGKIGFVYPVEFFNTIAQAQDAALPTMPPGLEDVPKLTAVIYQQGAVNFTNAIWQDVRAGISEESFAGVTDHGAMTGLGDDDHLIYLLASGARALAGAWDLGGQNLTNGGTITASFTGALTGQADTVATITGLAPDTATTQATQPNITTCANLTTVGTIGTGVWNGTSIADANVDNDITIDLATLATTANAGDAAVDFFGAGVDAVTDATTCTDIEGTGLSITTSTLNWSASGIAGHDSFSDFVANEHLDWTSDLGATNIHAGNYTNTTYTGGTGITLTGTVFSTTDGEIVHDSLNGFVANEHLDWTSDLGAVNIHAGNYTDTNTTYVSSDWTLSDITGYVANEHINWTADQGVTNIHAGNYTDTDTTYVSSDFTHDDLTGFVANEHIDWTSDQGATNIHSGNYTAGLTNLTDFDQTAWRLFYSNNLGDVIELSLGTNGEYLQSQGGTSSLTWSTPTDTTYTGGTGITLTGTVFSTTDSEIVHDNLSGFVANEHLDWTGDLGAVNIHAENYTDTTANETITLSG